MTLAFSAAAIPVKTRELHNHHFDSTSATCKGIRRAALRRPPDFGPRWWIVASREANELRRVRDFMSFAADQLRPLRGALNGTLDQNAARALFEALTA